VPSRHHGSRRQFLMNKQSSMGVIARPESPTLEPNVCHVLARATGIAWDRAIAVRTILRGHDDLGATRLNSLAPATDHVRRSAR
jgi:hypothetical protein